MHLYQTVNKVEKLFSVLEKDLNRFQDSSKLGCVAGCGLCCRTSLKKTKRLLFTRN